MPLPLFILCYDPALDGKQKVSFLWLIYIFLFLWWHFTRITTPTVTRKNLMDQRYFWKLFSKQLRHKKSLLVNCHQHLKIHSDENVFIGVFNMFLAIVWMIEDKCKEN